MSITNLIVNTIFVAVCIGLIMHCLYNLKGGIRKRHADDPHSPAIQIEFGLSILGANIGGIGAILTISVTLRALLGLV